VPEHIAKLDRIKNIYSMNVTDTPAQVFETLAAQRQRLLEAREKHGDYITPDEL
jgi:phosphoenolpyruvate carboxykinase (GTP)